MTVQTDIYINTMLNNLPRADVEKLERLYELQSDLVTNEQEILDIDWYFHRKYNVNPILATELSERAHFKQYVANL